MMEENSIVFNHTSGKYQLIVERKMFDRLMLSGKDGHWAIIHERREMLENLNAQILHLGLVLENRDRKHRQKARIKLAISCIVPLFIIFFSGYFEVVTAYLHLPLLLFTIMLVGIGLICAWNIFRFFLPGAADYSGLDEHLLIAHLHKTLAENFSMDSH